MTNMKTKLVLLAVSCITMAMFLIYRIVMTNQRFAFSITLPQSHEHDHRVVRYSNVDLTTEEYFDYSGRTDVPTVTSWGAPILWNGTFNDKHVDQLFAHRHITVGVTVFAIGRYLSLLKGFLDSAEQHFFVGHAVTYYVVTDQPTQVPSISLGHQRKRVIVTAEKRKRWQDICMDRFTIINKLIETTITETYIYCFDVDLLFANRWGPEVLADTVVVLHAWFFGANRKDFTYERKPESAAYVAVEEGDYYYHAALFGGHRSHLINVTSAIFRGIATDREAGIEAIWHDESHLNRYFIDNKPNKILSVEYCWDDVIKSNVMKVKRLGWVKKDNNIRENP